MLVCELTGLGDIRLTDALAAVQRDDSNWTARQQLDSYSALCSTTIFKGSLFAEHMDEVSSGPDANPDTCTLLNLPAFRDVEHSAPAKTSAFTETPNVSQAQEAMLESHGL